MNEEYEVNVAGNWYKVEVYFDKEIESGYDCADLVSVKFNGKDFCIDNLFVKYKEDYVPMIDALLEQVFEEMGEN